MNDNTICLQPISEVKKKNFFIPNYQRGYRWTAQQIKDLLDDINEFKSENSSWYCLQPLVLKAMVDEDKQKHSLKKGEDWYEVIDGQQRIITIFLLIHYFNEKWIGEDKLSEPCILFETRQDSSVFLENLKINGSTGVVSSEEADIHSHIDFEHISSAYAAMREWFTNQDAKFDRNKFQSKFQSDTQVIWYEIYDGSNPMAIFTRINSGKIPLTNSELIKALFLQKNNFDNSTAELRQIEIAQEWDRMEYALQNDDLWYFLNREQNEIPARIEFIFDLMFKVAKDKGFHLFFGLNEDKKRMIEKSIGTDHYATFRFFNEKFSRNQDSQPIISIWNEVKDYFCAFEDWFNNPILYHYIGYLISCKTVTTHIIDIYKLYKDSEKNAFLEKIKKEIQKSLKGVGHIDEEDEFQIDLVYTRKNNNNKINDLLLLFNVEYIVKQYKSIKDKNGNAELFLRFPFEIFKKNQWDIEHIDSATSNKISDKKNQNEWLRTSVGDLEGAINKRLLKEIDDFINDEKNKKFEEIKNKILGIAGEDTLDEDEKNCIGNLTLLDAETNRGYGNALFPTKRKIIIERDTSGVFIPICTRNVFLKYFDKEGSSRDRWGKDDVTKYQNHITEILKDVLVESEGESHE